MRRRNGPTPRAGYTLVELLVVIAIIAILAALLTSALSKVRQSIKKTTATSEMNQLDAALGNFERKHGFMPPSHVTYLVTTSAGPVVEVGLFRIPERVYDPSDPSLTAEQKREAASLVILRRMFPRWNPGGTGSPVAVTTSTGAQPLYVPTINGSQVRDLDPNQAMVYFLGGPGTLGGPASALNPGWDTAQPMAPTGSTRIDPYYTEFVEARMKDETGDFNNGTAGVFDGRYRDPWGTPYAYFACNAGSDQYEPKLQYPWPVTASPTVPAPPPAAATANAPQPYFDPTKDANDGEAATPLGTKTNTVHPLATSVSPTTGTDANIRWHNPKKAQIISAGPDKVWGRASYLPATGKRDVPSWKPGVGNGYGEAEKGNDDMANFNNGTALGAQGN